MCGTQKCTGAHHRWMRNHLPLASNRIRMKRVRKDKGHIPPQPLRSPPSTLHPSHSSTTFIPGGSPPTCPPPSLRLSAQFWFRAPSQSFPQTVTHSRSRQLHRFYRASRQASKGSKRARASCFVTLIPRFRFDFRSGTCEIASRFFFFGSFLSHSEPRSPLETDLVQPELVIERVRVPARFWEGRGEVVGRLRKILSAGNSSHGVADAAYIPGAWVIGFGLARCCGRCGCCRSSFNRFWPGMVLRML